MRAEWEDLKLSESHLASDSYSDYYYNTIRQFTVLAVSQRSQH